MTEAEIKAPVPKSIEMRRPDDFHLHLRDGAVLEAVLPATARNFARALIMPNLVPPVANVESARKYKRRILDALPDGCDFSPLMTLYLTESTSPEEIRAAASSGIVHAVKLYPAGATTNSASGVRNIAGIRPSLDAMEAADLPLCVHGEVTDPGVDIFDREHCFIDRVLSKLRRWNPELRIVFEHITTKTAADYVREQRPTLAATITVHHLVLNRSHLFEGGIRPHRFCLPVAKREQHRLELLRAAAGGDPGFFLGTDSAPHPDRAKLSPCGCAGIYSAPVALACLAQIFEDIGALSRLEAFVSEYGSRFYRLPLNSGTCRLVRQTEPAAWPPAPETGGDRIEVFDPGFPVYWRID